MNIKITKNAITALKKKFTEKEIVLIRISIKGGGCSGLTYKFTKETEKDETDLIVNIDNIDFIIDIFTINFLNNAVIDYIPNYDFDSSFVFNTPFNNVKCQGCK